jgi:1-acyl-sn-glycerol-3-phosphate acyltransferase
MRPPERVTRASLGLSLRNVYETLAICVPTLVDAVRGTVTKEACDERLARWSSKIVALAEMDLEVLGREHLPNSADPAQPDAPGAAPPRPYLVMSNHQSLYDIPVLFHVIGPNLRMVAKKELFRVPVFGKAIALGGFISIDRADRSAAIASLDAAKSLLGRGTHVWMAPEGTRSRDGRLLPFKKGGFHLALRAGLPILPVTLDGTRHVLPARAVRSRTGAHVRITIHPPIDPAPYAAQGKAGRDALSNDVRRALQAGLSS